MWHLSKTYPTTEAALRALWRQTGYQHFHFVKHGGNSNDKAMAWVVVKNLHTPVCEEPGRCIIAPVHRGASPLP